MKGPVPSSSAAQRGSTLIIAIVLLLLLTLVAFFGLSVGMSEQKSGAAEFRSRIVRQVAESALSHSFEYLRLSGFIPTEPQGEIDLTRWEPCLAADTTFPCAAIDASRRGNAYRFRGGVDFNGNGTIDTRFERYMIPLPNIGTTANPLAVSQVGNFPVRYGVGAVLCTLDEDRNCTRVDEERTGLATATMVAVAEIPGENARGTVVQSYGSFNIFSLPPTAPPLVAGGILTGVGNATLVGNPDSGGTGVNVSLWARGALDEPGGMGSWQSCELDEYLRSGTPYYSESGVMICDDCDCLTGEKLSGKKAVDGANGFRNDIQVPDPGGDANYTELFEGPDHIAGTSDDTIPSQFFPCDMFQFVFGRNARVNADGGDAIINATGVAGQDGIADPEGSLPYGVCEQGINNDADTTRLDVYDEYLESIEAQELNDCSTLNADSQGIYWIKGSCAVSGQVGTPEFPVVLIVEDEFSLQNAKLFGILFLMDPTLINLPADPGAIEGSELPPGGGKSQVYGSIIVEGGGKFNGNIDLVASPKVIENINNSPSSRRFGAVPGSWSDRFSF
jgi:hypothetical protein